jgi:lipoprotein-releasing system permease protein
MNRRSSSFEASVGWRYVKARRGRGFLSFTALASVLGVMIGVMALVVALSMASGFQSALRDKIIGVNAHLLLLSIDGRIAEWRQCLQKVSALPEVAAAMPFTYHQALLSSQHESEGAIVRGVDPEALLDVTSLGLELRCGSWHSLKEGAGGRSRPEVPPPVFLGKALAETLEVQCGDTVRVVVPSRVSDTRDMPAALETCRVGGIFEVGMYEYDASLALLPLRDAQEFFGMGDAVSGIEIRLKDPSRTDDVAEEVEALFGSPYGTRSGSPYWTKSWKEINQNFFSALQLQKAVMFLVLTLIVLVGAFNIVSTLILTVMDKTKEIAILKSMGATRGAVIRIFTLQGAILGGMGSALGLAGGYLLATVAGAYPLIRLDPDIYYLSRLPVEIRPAEFILVGTCAMILCIAASLYPAFRAGRLDPAEVLRYV